MKSKLGSNHVCVLCEKEVDNFLPYEIDLQKALAFVEKYQTIGSDINNFSCPYCYSNDRERHLYLYLKALNIWDTINAQTSILHIAPERLLSILISKRNPLNYIKGDLYPENSSVQGVIKVDITNPQFDDDFFDIILANHIFEHIFDDVRAMNEIYRMLKKDGIAILQTPYSLNLANTYEDASIIGESEREEHFGQSDHIRIYSEQDFFNKLASAGFILNIHKSSEFFNEEEARKYGFNHKEDLILCLKTKT
ncbi:MAG: class I SAM-dependent methyltransferase [Lachnospiraceae bacterium]|nr:class I SAM-dependent methyltransferase [Lachnospiraceae bacterium]